MLHSALSLLIHKFGRTQLINIDSARVLLLQCEVRSLSGTSCANSDVCSRLETSLVLKKEIKMLFARSLDFTKCAEFRAN